MPRLSAASVKLETAAENSSSSVLEAKGCWSSFVSQSKEEMHGVDRQE